MITISLILLLIALILTILVLFEVPSRINLLALALLFVIATLLLGSIQ